MKALKAAALACLFIPPLSMADDSLASLFAKLDHSVEYYPDSQRVEEIIGKLSSAEYYQLGKLVGICTHYTSPNKQNTTYHNYLFENAMKAVSEIVQKPMEPEQARKFCEKVRQNDYYITKIIKHKP